MIAWILRLIALGLFFKLGLLFGKPPIAGIVWGLWALLIVEQLHERRLRGR